MFHVIGTNTSRPASCFINTILIQHSHTYMFHVVRGSVFTAKAELSSWERNHRAHKENICCLAFYFIIFFKLPTSGLEHRILLSPPTVLGQAPHGVTAGLVHVSSGAVFGYCSGNRLCFQRWSHPLSQIKNNHCLLPLSLK